MIKKYKYLLIFILLFTSKSHALSPEYEKELYIGCYTNSKQYLGTDGAKIYCQCTVSISSNKKASFYSPFVGIPLNGYSYSFPEHVG